MKTIYAVACYYDESDYPEGTILLGWNNNYDWFDTDSYVDDILTPKGNLKKVHNGLINVNRWTAVYVGEKVEDVQDYMEDANEEGIEAIVVKIEITDGELKVIPQK